MQPVPIPDRRIWAGTERVTIGAPRGREAQVSPVEVLIEAETVLGPAFHLLVKLDPEDLDQLQNDPHFWLTIYGQVLQPFSLTVPEP